MTKIDNRTIISNAIAAIGKKDVKTIVKDVLYSKEGATSYHQGNPFARAFNDALNR